MVSLLGCLRVVWCLCWVLCVDVHKRLRCILSGVGVCAPASVIATAAVAASCAVASVVIVWVIA